MKIEEGKYYRSRDDHIYGPMFENDYGFVVKNGYRIDPDENFDWYVNGRVLLWTESANDLIEEVSVELPEYIPDNLENNNKSPYNKFTHKIKGSGELVYTVACVGIDADELVFVSVFSSRENAWKYIDQQTKHDVEMGHINFRYIIKQTNVDRCLANDE